jgi:hypothetical protein
MSLEDNTPDWDQPVTLSIVPSDLINALFVTANSVHTGWSSCVEKALVVNDTAAMDERTGNYVRLAEQELTDEENSDVTWHDWTVEILLGDVMVTGHWQIQLTAAPLDWEWCAREAESAFEKAALLVGKRVRRTLTVDTGPEPAQPATRHH